jgi:hypothetical protein
VTSEEATDLLNLQCLWRDAYAIAFNDGVWSARRHDRPAAILTADTALELRGLMRTTTSRHGPLRPTIPLPNGPRRDTP